MHAITDHKLNGLNEAIEVTAMDEPGPGGANHRYSLRVISPPGGYDIVSGSVVIDFQKGPINEAGLNGLSNEALIAVLIDRMRGFQSGPFASRDNDLALAHLEQALMWLHKRTRERMARGVEGTHAK